MNISFDEQAFSLHCIFARKGKRFVKSWSFEWKILNTERNELVYLKLGVLLLFDRSVKSFEGKHPIFSLNGV